MEPEDVKWKTAFEDGKKYLYECEAGKPLRFDAVGQKPKKLLKRLEREWRDLNHTSNGFRMPRLRCKYHITVLLRDWLMEKVGKGAA